MSNLRLFEIANQFRQLEDIALTDDIPAEVIRDTLEGLEGDFDAKAIACAKFVLNLEASALAIWDAADEMQARGARVQKRADSVRAYLLFNLQAVDRRRIESSELVIRRVVNPPAVQITDEQVIPASFWIEPPPPALRLDKKSIAAAIKGGAQVPGAYLKSSERVDIKL